jgi:Leucine-rich repeat (LRR) protein
MNKFLIIILILSFNSFGQTPTDKTFESIEDALINPSIVKTLYLIDKNLNHLSTDILKLYNLEKIVLDENPKLNLEETFYILGKFEKLKYLSLSDNKLVTVPENIEHLNHLEELDLDGNEISILPKSIKKLKKLKSLHLFDNKLTSLNFEKGDLPNLLNINLCYNEFTIFPTELSNLSSLKRIMIWYNNISVISKDIKNFKNLEELNLESNNISHLPNEISKLNSLKILSLRSNQLAEENILPVFKIKSLESLSFENNKISNIPSQIGQLKNLTKLNLSSNPILDLPNELLKLKKIEQIALNELDKINWSEAFNILSKIPTLQRVGMCSMKKDEMPDGFDKLQQVKTFWLNLNRFNKAEKERIKSMVPNSNAEFN